MKELRKVSSRVLKPYSDVFKPYSDVFLQKILSARFKELYSDVFKPYSDVLKPYSGVFLQFMEIKSLKLDFSLTNRDLKTRVLS